MGDLTEQQYSKYGEPLVRCVDCGGWKLVVNRRGRCQSCDFQEGVRQNKERAAATKTKAALLEAERRATGRSGYTCAHCGQRYDIARWEIHHTQRVADGGTSDPSNLVMLCRDCHMKAHSREARS